MFVGGSPYHLEIFVGLSLLKIGNYAAQPLYCMEDLYRFINVKKLTIWILWMEEFYP
jgi:hypothetical protein